MSHVRALAVVAVLAVAPVRAEGPTTTFRPADIVDWPQRSFVGNTAYELTEAEGRAAVRAIADGTASALYREIEVDPAETPYLEWSWRADALPAGDAGERTKDGDDYGVRVYVVREGLLGKLSARTLSYVWARREPVGASWPNAFTDRARMVAVASGRERLGEWITYRRDVRADWQAAFGESIDRIDGVAIMTDADNTGSTARGFYGRIRFATGDGE